jgi:hypothetical protein
LTGHDEYSENVTVLDETLTVRNVKFLRETGSRCILCLRNRNDNIDLFDGFLTKGSDESISELEAHVLSTPVDTDAIDDHIWSGKVDIFKAS